MYFYSEIMGHEEVEDVCERCDMMAPELFVLGTYVDGYYYADNESEFYCVWTKDHTVEEIAYIDGHETAHILVNRMYDHFCEDILEKKDGK